LSFGLAKFFESFEISLERYSRLERFCWTFGFIFLIGFFAGSINLPSGPY
jgi:hypothetical protein